MPDNLQQDALQRLNDWLDKLEEHAKKLLDNYQPEELEPAQAASLAGKYIMLIARLLELRQQFTNESSSYEERLLRLILGQQATRETDQQISFGGEDYAKENDYVDGSTESTDKDNK